MIGKIFLVVVGIGVVAFVAWVVLAFVPQDTGRPDMPDNEEATHSFYIENTGGLIYASDFEQHGDKVGSRIFALHGFWEMRGDKFKFVEGDIILNESIFGEITVKRRVK